MNRGTGLIVKAGVAAATTLLLLTALVPGGKVRTIDEKEPFAAALKGPRPALRLEANGLLEVVPLRCRPESGAITLGRSKSRGSTAYGEAGKGYSRIDPGIAPE